jgi:outer membrane protein assembly factor BamB
MGRSRGTPTRTKVLLAVSGVVVIALAVGAWGVFAGWYDQGAVRGTTKGFVPVAAPQANASAPSWPTFGNTPESARSNTALNVSQPYIERWNVDTGSLIELPPVIGGGRVVAGTNHGIAIAIDLQTGKVDWRVQLGGAVAASPALTGLPDTASAGQPRYDLLATINGYLIALDPATGGKLWQISLGSAIETSPLVIGDGVFIGTRAGQVVRVSLTTHRPTWTVTVGGSVKGAMARSGSNVVVGDYAGHVSAFSQATGRVAWRTTSPGKTFAGPGRFYAGAAVAYGRVFIGNVNGRVLGLDAATGAINWVQVFGNYVYSSAAVADRMVFVGSYDGNLYALSAITGDIVWHRHIGQSISGSPSVLGNLVWVSTLGIPTSAGHGYAFNVYTGKPEVFRPVGRYVAAVGVGGTIVATGVDTLAALTPNPNK